MSTTARSAATRAEDVTLRLRQLILAGKFAPGTHLAEIPLAERLGVSRSPLRMALVILEHEGLLNNTPRRGFEVREITIAEVADGFEVRAALEALASRQAIERGLNATTRVALQECVDEGERMLAKGHLTAADTQPWNDMNGRFHDAIIDASRNAPLAAAYRLNSKRPLVSTTAIAFSDLDTSYRNMRRVQSEHVAIVDAMRSGDIARAGSLASEHALQSKGNLTRLLQTVKAQRHAHDLPGFGLLVEPS